MYLAAVFLRGAGYSHRDVKEAVYDLGRSGCSPRLPGTAVAAQIKAALEKRILRLKNQTIANWLKITTEEAQLLEKFPAAIGNAPPVRPVTPSKKDEISARRRRIQELIADNAPAI